MSLVVFDQYVNLSMTETVDQSVDKFNAASRGAIVLVPGQNEGDFSKKASYKAISGLVRRRDQYGSGAVSAVDIEQLLEASVKVGGGTPPVNMPPHLWSWIQKSPQEAGAVIGQQLGLAKVQDMLNVGISAAVAAISNVGASLVHDGTGANATLAALNSGSAKFGDRSQILTANVMHSKVFHDLVAKGLTNAERLFTFENVIIMQDAMGRPFIITDSPGLLTSGSPDVYHTLSLASGGIVIEENNDFLMNVETSNGDENIKRTYQAEWSLNVALKGYTWDTANGGKSPNDAALATGTNWDKTATSIKDTAGVLTNTD